MKQPQRPQSQPQEIVDAPVPPIEAKTDRT